MAQTTSGKVLREARERKGYDLNTVARRLRIRPDILRAIEAGDFSAMPPRGYTRNMVNAYARLLGLNPTEIVNMYLDEAYANQVERARGSAPSSGFNMERESRRSRSRAAQTLSTNRSYESDRISTIRSGVTSATRVLYDDGTRFARDDYGVTRERTPREGKSDRDFLSHHSGYDTSNFSFLDEQASGRQQGRSVYAGQTPNSWPASRVPGFLQNILHSRIALIIAGVILLIIIVAIAFAVFGGHGDQKQDDVAQLPVSGVADTTGDSSSAAASSAAVELAPTSARVIYSVPSGKECYVETYLDGQMTPEMLSGPVERSVDVTGVWVITTYSPETLNLTVDGTAVTMKVDQQYNSMYAYTVDFPSILQKWNAEHGISGAAARTTTTTTQTSAASASANSANSTSVSTQSNQQSYEQSVNYDESLMTDADRQANEAALEEEQQTEEEAPAEEEYYEEPVYTEEYAGDYTEDDGGYVEETQDSTQ